MTGRPTRFALLLIALFAALAAAAPAHAKLPPVKHVWTIVLENEDADTSFGPTSPAQYLSTTLRARGEFLPNYYGITHASLGNYLAMISGQGSNKQTQADCQSFNEFASSGFDSHGQALGQGCVYPAAVKTVADQLQAKGLSWRGYMEDMGNDTARDSGSRCAHPAFGTHDSTLIAAKDDQYATRHNPFVYFHSLLDSGSCTANDVPLTGLQGDLAAGNVPTYTFITPNLCHDGHDHGCANGETGGLTSADAFLKTWIPRIQATKAYKDGGVIVINFDEASGSDTTACCSTPKFPNTGSGNYGGGKGGGRTGAVVLSKFVKPGTFNPTPYNHFSLLRSFESLFGLGYLGYAGEPGLRAFGSDVFNACYEGSDRPRPSHGRYRRGAVIASASVHSRVLKLTMRHSARVSGAVGRHRAFSSRTAVPCKTYRIRLSRRHGSLTLKAKRGHGVETRVLRF